MIAVDTSAIVSILFKEPEWPEFGKALLSAPRRIIAVPSVVELHVVLQRRGVRTARELADAALREYGIEAEAFTPAHLDLARTGFERFGRGRHRAALNFGDCFSYALAKERGCPLLFKGDDFMQTDVPSAL